MTDLGHFVKCENNSKDAIGCDRPITLSSRSPSPPQCQCLSNSCSSGEKRDAPRSDEGVVDAPAMFTTTLTRVLKWGGIEVKISLLSAFVGSARIRQVHDKLCDKDSNLNNGGLWCNDQCISFSFSFISQSGNPSGN